MTRTRYDDDSTDGEEEDLLEVGHPILQEEEGDVLSEDEAFEQQAVDQEERDELEIGAHMSSSSTGRGRGTTYYGAYLEGEVKALRSGDARLVYPVDISDYPLHDGCKAYIRPLGVSSPVVLGVFVEELGEHSATHRMPNGVFHHVFPVGAHVNDDKYLLGKVGHLSTTGRKRMAERSLRKGVKLSQPREVDVDELWGTRLSDLDDDENDDLRVTHMEDEGYSMFGAKHPLRRFLREGEDYEQYGQRSYHMPMKHYQRGWQDLRAVVGHMERYYPQRMTVYVQPVYTDRVYDRDDPAQWDNVMGVNAFYWKEGLNPEGAYNTDIVSTQFELVIE